MPDQTYIVNDYTTGNTKTFNNLTSAETYAVQIMDKLGFRWTRAEISAWIYDEYTHEFNVDVMEYAKFPAIGSCIIYVRISRKN